ncbi:MAG TPA: GAF domain-containing protein [Anaerolineae bacterium]|nr:GAF domain-containing protein [Anaerolineae bacterium]
MTLVNEVRGTMHFLQQENSRLAEENEHLQSEVVRLRLVLRNLGALQEISMHINARTDVMQLLDRILQVALESIGAEDGSLLLQDPETNELVFVVVRGAVRDSLTSHRIPSGEGIAGYVAQSRLPVIIANAQLDQRFSSRIDLAFNFKTRSVLAVPVLHDAELKGVIQVLNKQNRQEFNDTDMMILNIVAQLAADAIARAELFSEDN